jgi:Ca-activated chloride channel family protein
MTMAQLLERLHKDNVQVFAVGIHPPKQGAVPRRRFPVEQSISFLNTLTRETGGRSVFPKSESELRESAELISSYIRAQYVIGYNAAQSAGEGSFREIIVLLSNAPRRAEYLVSARRRYAVSAP